MIAMLALLAASPRPVDGPALPVGFLSKPTNVQIGSNWQSGLYNVTFTYHSQKSVADLAALCKKLPNIDHSPYDIPAPSATVFAIKRKANGVKQIIWASRSTLYFNGYDGKKQYSGSKDAAFTTVSVMESVDPDELPKAWYRGAISPKPPIPLIEIPFLPGVHCQTVSLTSFEGLMSSRGIMYRGTDAAIFNVSMNRPYQQVLAELQKWAAANGYTKTPVGSYFKPKTKVFEIALSQTKTGCGVTLWTSDRPAVHPVVWDKF